MTTTMKTALVLPATILGLLAFSGTAKANTWAHLDQLALRLQAQTEELHDEAHAHFRQTPVYAAFDQNVDQMEKLAGHIHDLAHNGASLPHLSNDLRQLNVLQHNAEHLLALMGRWGQLDPVAYRHLCEGIKDVGLTVRHMRNDLRALEHQCHFGTPGVGHGTGYQPGVPYGQPGIGQFPQAGGFRTNFGGMQIQFGIRR